MLRMCASTVFWLRYSSAAISGLVRRSTSRRATCSSRALSDATPTASWSPRCRAPVDPVPEAPHLALGLVAESQGPVGLEVGGGPLQLLERLGRASGEGQRTPGERAGEGGLDRGAGLGRERRRVERPRGRSRRVARVQRDGGRGAMGPRRGHRKARGRRHGIGAGRGALGLASPTQHQQGAGQHVEILGPPPARDESEVVSAPRRDEQGGGCGRVAGCERAHGPAHAGVGRHEARVEAAREVDALVAGSGRQVDVPRPRGHVATVQEIPCEPLPVPGDARPLDRRIQHLGRLRQPAARPERRRERRDEDGQQLSLAGGARDGQRTAGMVDRALEAVQVDLGAGEKGGRVEPGGELGVGHGVDDRRRLRGVIRRVRDRRRERAAQ